MKVHQGCQCQSGSADTFHENMVPALFLSDFCDAYMKKVFSSQFFFIYIYVGLQSIVAVSTPPPPTPLQLKPGRT
jgi:hypothetical protein